MPTPAVTQHQVAREINVSRSTVAKVLSADPEARISEGVRKLVLETAARMGYRPNRSAQLLRNGKSGLVGIINLGPARDLPRRKLQAVAETILKHRYEPLAQEALWFGELGGDAGELACQRMIDARVEGVVLVDASRLFEQRFLDQLLKAGIPVVVIAGTHLRGIPRFESDREWGYETMTNHVLSLGHRHLVLFSPSKSNSATGFRRACKAWPKKCRAEVRPVPKQVRGAHRDAVPYLPGKLVMEEIIAEGALPDVVLCNNDELALGVMTACSQAGIRIPGEMAVTGFDNQPAAEFGVVPVTTLRHPVEQLAEAAVACLVEMMKTGKSPTDRMTRIRGELIVRHSCGAALKKN
ncbi:MAG TPA: LacI family DNA-binding transcriptional regulator [Chthoniobacteraceae bacterium]|nr:LacI family DNA-binding transcriptional regulator [Chthoniobacteraceae bacterium]